MIDDTHWARWEFHIDDEQHNEEWQDVGWIRSIGYYLTVGGWIGYKGQRARFQEALA